MRRLLLVLRIWLLDGLNSLTMGGGSDDGPTPAKTPTETIVDNSPLQGIFAESAAEVPISPTATPAGQTLRLKRVELGPGTELAAHTHGGAFSLFVESGAICYAVVADSDSGISEIPEVIANPGSDETAPAGCGANVPPERCVDGTCTLQPGDIIYLPTWSSVTQSGTTNHSYWNPHPNRSALVFLAELQDETDEAGCFGGCH